MNTKTIASILLIIGIAALLFLNFNPIFNNRFRPQSQTTSLQSTAQVESRLKNQSIENLPTQTEKWSILEYEVIMESNSDNTREVKTGDRITVNYTGWHASNGKIFASSLNEGRTPYTFIVGRGVIEGWSQGVVGMKLGEVRRLKIPASLAYADVGQGDIEPNEDLYFDVELLAFN